MRFEGLRIYVVTGARRLKMEGQWLRAGAI
jgi:hypothetical protein